MQYIPKNKKELYELIINKEIYLGDIDVSQITDMSGLFAGCEKEMDRDYAGLENWDTSNVINMSWIFRHNPYFNHCINDWNVSKVVDMSCAFLRATSFNQPLNKWDISNVRNIDGMFFEAKNFNQDLSSWNINAFIGAMLKGNSKFDKKKYYPKIISELSFKEMRKFLEERGL